MLGWDVPGTPHNGIIREYRLNITEVETGRVIQEVAATDTVTVGNLHPDYSYDWIVTAFTVEVGPYSVSSRVTTPEDGRLEKRDGILWYIMTLYSLDIPIVPVHMNF